MICVLLVFVVGRGKDVYNGQARKCLYLFFFNVIMLMTLLFYVNIFWQKVHKIEITFVIINSNVDILFFDEIKNI